MNKRILNSYMKKKSNKELLKTNCFKYGDKYIVSDSYSVIVLNDNYDLNVKDDKYNLYQFVENFKNNFDLSYTFFKLNDSDIELGYGAVTETHGINVKEFKKINNIIKGNCYAIYNNQDKKSYMPFVIYLENNKTKEYAYLLPMRKF